MAIFNRNNQTNQQAGVVPPATAAPQQVVAPGQEELEVTREREILEAERVYREGIATVKDIIAPSAMKVSADKIQVGDHLARTLFVYTYPRFLQVGWLSPIVNMNQAMDISMFVYPVSSEKILKTLRKRAAQISSQIRMDAEKGKVRDPLIESAQENVEVLRDQLIQGTEHLYKYALYITLYSKTEEGLDELTAEIESILGARMILTKHTSFQMEQGFNSTLPLGNDELAVTNNMNTSPLATSFPFISSELTSNDGILYGINRHNNSLILFDRFSLENANSVIFAKSGAGKSYTTKLEVLRSMMLGSDVIIIDPENEYEHMAATVDGAYLNISLASENRLNPFDLPRESDEQNADVIRGAVTNVKGLINLMLGTLNAEEDSIMDRALLETYAKKDINENSDLRTVEFPTMQDLAEVLEGIEGAENLLIRIKKYTEGTFSGLLNNPTNVDLRRQLIVFNIRDLEEELRPIGMYLILNYIWNIVRQELKKRILIIDEAWIMMQNDDSARFLFGMAKRARKYFLGVTTISQDVSDFLASRYGRAVVSNSSLQLLLKQSPSTVDLIQEVFHLTDEEKFLLLESDVGEGIFFAGLKHAAIHIVASYSEDQIITSDPRQLLQIEDAKREFAEAQG
ncbi:VirB4-like conjugal transfer ATPase, CD1110 family [Patescibacteria group bacterium]